MLKRLRSVYIPILTQITVPYVILAILIAAGGTYIITQVVVDSVEERFTNQLVDTAVLAEESLVREEDQILESLRLVSHIQGVDLALESRDFTALRDLVLPVAFNAGVEAIAFVDASGRTVLSLYLNSETQEYESLVPTTPYTQLAFLSSVLRGEVDEAGDKYSGFATTAKGEILFIAGPVTTADGRRVGAAMIGRSAQSLGRMLREETLGHVTFYSLTGTPLISTLLETSTIEPDQAQIIIDRQDEGSLQRSLTASGVSYSELLTPLEVRAGEDIGVMGVALATRFLVQTGQITRGNTYILMSAALVMVLVVGALVAGRITRPLRNLKDAALKVARGDLGVKVGQLGQDEVGVLGQSFNDMVDSLSQSKRELLDAYDKTIEGWSRALDLRDHETEGHSIRVAELSARLGKAVGLKPDQLQQLRRGALLHDVGKIAVPDSILLKEDKLTPAEMSQIRRHPDYAKQFMEHIEFLKPAMDVPYAHHEKWDGSGYPRGLKGEQIPLLARIFAVVDVWDAITSDRPYRKAMEFSKSMDILKSGAGHHFDPAIVDAFIKLLGDMLKEKQAIR